MTLVCVKVPPPPPIPRSRVDPLPGLAALKLPERPTVEASSSFFLAFIGLATSVVGVAEVLQVKGRLLVQYILEAIAGAASRSYLPSFSDILDALLSHCMTLLSQWLNVSVCTCVYMYVCVCVCVCMYVCMYVCMCMCVCASTGITCTRWFPL